MTDPKLQIHSNLRNKNIKIIEKELSYKLGGIFFEIQRELGRFCRERQYADVFEKKLRDRKINFKREYPIEIAYRKSNFVDFIIEDRVLIDFKTKPFLEKDDYFQMKRYLEISRLALGLIVNFQDKYLRPRRVLNNTPKFVDSDKFVVLDRSIGFTIIEMLVVIGVLGMLLTTTMVFYGRAGERQIALFREQAKILNTLSRAKFLTIQTYGQKTEERVPCGYGVHFESPQTFILFKDEADDCGGADNRYSGEAEKIETFALDRTIFFDVLSLSDIVFIPPNPRVVITPEQDQAVVTIKTSDDKGRVSVKINSFGQISTQ